MMKLAMSGLAVLAVAGASSIALATPKYDKSHAPQGEGTRGLLDCTVAIDAGCGFNYSGNNQFGNSNVTTYSCTGFSESGPEDVFRLVLASTSNVDIVMDTDGGDLDLFLLASCDEGDCIAFSAAIEHEEIHEKCLPAGEYFVVVDGYNGTIANYSISINCTDCTPPPGNETCGTADPLGCGAIAFDTNTAGTNNDYQLPDTGSCTGYNSSGGDLVWSVCIPAGGTLDLVFYENSYDGSAYVVTDCANVVGSCITGSDCYPFPCNNPLFYTNTGGSDLNAFLIIDGYGGASGTGRVTGTVDCCGGTATQPTTWGMLKSKF